MLKMKTCVESEVERNHNRIPDGRKIRFYHFLYDAKFNHFVFETFNIDSRNDTEKNYTGNIKQNVHWR